MLELYTLSAPESPVRAWMRWTIGRERQTVTWMSLKEHVAHTGITLSNHVSLHVYCTWHLCHHAVPLNSMLNLSLFPRLRSLIPCHMHTSQPHIFPGCLRSVQIWGSKHTPSWESVCMQSFAVLDGWPGPFQTAESSGRIQKDEPIPQLRWNSGTLR